MNLADDSRETSEAVSRVLDWARHEAPSGAIERLTDFHDWLAAEAIPAGGLGPDEGTRLWRRHIADSLCFLGALDDEAASVVDIGSGVGLPGIPLAIVLPEVPFVLLDRSERRCRLARRAVRILQLSNVEVVASEAHGTSFDAEVAVTRASFPLVEIPRLAAALLPDGRFAIAARSHGVATDSAGGGEVIRVPPDVLGADVTLVRFSLSG